MRIIEEGYCVYHEPQNDSVPLSRCYYGTRINSYYTSIMQAQRQADRYNKIEGKIIYSVRKVALVDMEDE